MPHFIQAWAKPQPLERVLPYIGVIWGTAGCVINPCVVCVIVGQDLAGSQAAPLQGPERGVYQSTGYILNRGFRIYRQRKGLTANRVVTVLCRGAESNTLGCLHKSVS